MKDDVRELLSEDLKDAYSAGKQASRRMRIVAGPRRIEHYEIAAFGTDFALANALGERDVADLPVATLKEEKQADVAPTKVTEQHIMAAAMGGPVSEKPRRAAAENRRNADASRFRSTPLFGETGNSRGRHALGTQGVQDACPVCHE